MFECCDLFVIWMLNFGWLDGMDARPGESPFGRG